MFTQKKIWNKIFGSAWCLLRPTSLTFPKFQKPIKIKICKMRIMKNTRKMSKNRKFEFSLILSLVIYYAVWGCFPGVWRLWNYFLTSETVFQGFPWNSCTNDTGFPGISRNSPKFEDLYLRAQEELEARTTCVGEPRTWSFRKIKKCWNIFSEKKVTAR